ncbi:MAG: biopolymer transporter ExbD, partial [Kiritimatiellia bacterium]|nr:biopolymer transporter ExbD [Kiritimatiellia bacterium]
RKRVLEEGVINMTPMIDVVFQLIIFFVITADMQNENLQQILKLAMAPHGVAVQIKDPREINIDVDSQGRAMIARTRYSQDGLRWILRKAYGEYGPTVPIIIRADGKTQHEAVRVVMDACAGEGFWRIKFGAIKEQADIPK